MVGTKEAAERNKVETEDVQGKRLEGTMAA
jgi:hypothetical protein